MKEYKVLFVVECDECENGWHDTVTVRTREKDRAWKAAELRLRRELRDNEECYSDIWPEWISWKN